MPRSLKKGPFVDHHLAKKVEVASAAPEHSPGGLRMLRLVNPPEVASSTTILGEGPEAASAVADMFEELGLL